MIKTLPIKLIELAGGTQQRPLDEETINRYVELIKDDVELPPVDVIFDGRRYWLYDGFHRIKAFQILKLEKIKANVKNGTKRDAMWYSYGANSRHGLPRQKGSLIYIITAIILDEKWGKKSDIEIARHVGCTRQHVHNIRKPKDEPEESEEFDKIPDSEPKTKKKDVNSLHREPQEMLDKEGGNIPFKLRERWLGKSIIEDKIKHLDWIKNAVVHAIEEGNMSWCLLNQTAFEADVKSLRNRLISALPYALCCYCDGEGCGSCHNMGFLNEQSWMVAPKK